MAQYRQLELTVVDLDNRLLSAMLLQSIADIAQGIKNPQNTRRDVEMIGSFVARLRIRTRRD